MTSRALCFCGVPVKDDAYACAACTSKVQLALSQVPALVRDLETTRTRQSRIGGRGIGVVSRDAGRPLPWDQRASAALDALRVVLVGWARVVLDERGPAPAGPACVLCSHPSCEHSRSGPPPVDSPDGLAAYLARHLAWLRHHPAVAELVRDIDQVVRRGRHVTDRAPDRVYAGTCLEPVHRTDERTGLPAAGACPGELYATAAATHVTCMACGAVHDVLKRQEWLRALVEDQLATATQLAGAVSGLGRTVTSSQIRGYAHRDRLIAKSVDAEGRPLYRVGDLLDLLARDAAKRAAS